MSVKNQDRNTLVSRVMREVWLSVIKSIDPKFIKLYQDALTQANDPADRMRIDNALADKVTGMRNDGLIEADPKTVRIKAEDIVDNHPPDEWTRLAQEYARTLLVR